MYQNVKNISELIEYQATKQPGKRAISMAKKKLFGGYSYPGYDFQTMNQRVNKFCNKLESLGVKSGHRVLFFIKPNLDFCAITFALFRMGAIPVFIDPGMKKEHFFTCIKGVKPDVLLGIPKIHYARHLYKKYFSNIKIFITTGRIGFASDSIYTKLGKESDSYTIYTPKNDDLAAILYTSGGTGVPKGVEYQHDVFINQTKMLQNEFGLTCDDIDIPGFPLFSFFTLAMGMSSCIPDMDPADPINCDPRKLYQNITDRSASFIAGSPAIWERLADYCLRENLVLDSVKYVVMFGAPVSVKIHQKFARVLPQGTTYTPYGATECLPIANTSGKFLLASTYKDMLSGKGTCVGNPLNGVNIKIIEQVEHDISKLEDIVELTKGDIGEILVNSPNVTRAYFCNEDANSKSKVIDANGKTWHRMGDVGYFDENGLLWFCGRKKHVVEVKDKKYYPTQIESIYNQHAKIKRSALIFDQKNNCPAVVIERFDQKESIESMFLMDLKNLSQTNIHTKEIGVFYAKSSFPVDVRHNIKIDRTKLQDEVNGV
jgi:acyl-CoA synthetase (AMP-forming)/AMP-acid ligase II